MTQDIKPQPPRPATTGRGAWAAVAALVVGVAAGLAIGRLWGRHDAGGDYARLQAQYQQNVARSAQDLAALHAKTDMLQGQLAVEQSTRSGLESSLQHAQDELSRARDRLAFYDQLLPPGPKGSIGIRAFEVRAQGAVLHYRVLLMRNATGDTPFKGTMQFVATGLAQGKTVKINLEPAQAAGGRGAQPGALALEFDQFQRSQGLLSLPDGFIPRTVTLDIYEGKTLRASGSADVPLAESP
jgi:hypothetical protein